MLFISFSAYLLLVSPKTSRMLVLGPGIYSDTINEWKGAKDESDLIYDTILSLKREESPL